MTREQLRDLFFQTGLPEVYVLAGRAKNAAPLNLPPAEGEPKYVGATPSAWEKNQMPWI